MPLLVINARGEVVPFAADLVPRLLADDSIVALVQPDADTRDQNLATE